MGLKRYGLILVVGAIVAAGVCAGVQRAIAASPPIDAELVQDGVTHDEYRTGLHRTANDGVGELVQAGDWDAEAGAPRIARSGEGALTYFGAPEGYGVSLGSRADSSTSVKNFLLQYAAAFGLYSSQSDLYLTRTTSDGVHAFFHFGQTYGGVPVHGAEVIVQTDAREASVQAVSADLMRDTYVLDTDPDAMAPGLSAEQGASAALSDSSARIVAEVQTRLAELDDYAATDAVSQEDYAAAEDTLRQTAGSVARAAELVVYAPEVLGMEGDACLAWRAGVRAEPAPVSDEDVFIDARTGEALFAATRIEELGDRRLYDANQGTTLGGSTFRRGETDPPVNDPAVDINFGVLGTARAYFTSTLGWAGYINPTSPNQIYSYVDWGTVGSAAWDSTTKTLRFGQYGYSQADDVVGHEYTHGVLGQVWPSHGTTGETGAIAESICDFFGEMIDLAHTGNDTGDPAWAIGEDLTNGAIRGMSDPAAYDQPSWRGHELYYVDTDTSVFASTNSGVLNKLWSLLVDGTGTGSFCEYEVAALGQSDVQALVWDVVENHLVSNADFTDLYEALVDASISLGFTTSQRESVENACRAVSIAPIEESVPPAGQKGLNDVHIIRSYFWATGTGYNSVPDPENSNSIGKRIPYKVYVPDDGLDLDGTGGRPAATWPLDVIIFSHGAGMNLEMGSGVPGSIDGIAQFWAKKGYIVVVPTYRKQHRASSPIWEKPYLHDTIAKAVTDAGYGGDPNKAGYFYADRLRDLKTINDNLDTIINQNVNSATYGAYEPGVSEVALAGYSAGAVTTALASGIVWNQGGILLDMEAAPGNFRRLDNGGTPSNISDDSGPFIDAEAYLNISETMFDGAELGGSSNKTVHTLLNTGRPNLTGRDMIPRPFMLIAGSKDVLVKSDGRLASNIADAHLYDSVTGPYGLHDAPRYGVIIDGANHVTPVGWFDARIGPFTSWGVHPIWGIVLQIVGLVDALMPEEKAFFDGGSFEAKLEETMNAMFSGVGSTKNDEERRLAKIQEYTLAFWDAYLSPRYDGATAIGFLSAPEQEHRDDPDIYDEGDIHGFVRRDPTHGFVVKNNSGAPLVQFQSDGNVLISSGTFSSSNGGTVPTSTLVREFIVKASNGINLMKVDSGGLLIKRTLLEGQASLAAGSGPEFIIRDVSDTGSSARIILDANGNLKIRGAVYEPSP